MLENLARSQTTGLRCDQTIVLAGVDTAKEYSQTLRCIKNVEPDTGKRLVFLTNKFALDALTIAKLCKCRWQVELFFKWIKQRLRIKTFFGTSDNAVKTQVWIAIRVYLLVAIVKKEHRVERSMNEIQQILSLNLFEKTLFFSALSGKVERNPTEPPHKHLSLFDL